MSEEDAGGMAEGAEPSNQYSITFCSCVTDGSWGAVWHNGMKVQMKQRGGIEFLHAEKNMAANEFTDISWTFLETKQ